MFFFQYPEWIVFDFGNWSIKEEAPEYVKKEFDRLMGLYKDAFAKGDIME